MARRNRSKSTNRSQRRNTPLAGHRQHGKVLRPPLTEYPNIQPVNSARDMVPEYLWLDALLDAYPLLKASKVTYTVLDVLDTFVPQDNERFLDGTISTFDLVPLEAREQAVDALQAEGLYDSAFPLPLRHGLSLYSACPAGWLFAKWRKDKHINFESGLNHLKWAIRRLIPRRDAHRARCQMLALARRIKHGKIALPPAPELTHMLVNYPHGLDEKEQRFAESTVRAMSLAFWQQDSKELTWPAAFWRHNYTISTCEFLPPEAATEGYHDVLTTTITKLEQALAEFRQALRTATGQVALDLYEPAQDEVYFGLLSRQFRLFSTLALEPNLWTPQVSGVFYRLMADMKILVRWLAQRNDPALFQRFKEYSLGKQKLFKLHIEELPIAQQPMGQQLIEVLGDSIDEEIWEEFVSIDVGSLFEKMDTRKMAQEAGLKDFYDLVYQPYSADVHGEWVVLKTFYLQHCMNPLHLYHRVPRLDLGLTMSPQIVLSAARVLADTVHAWAKVYNAQQLETAVDRFIANVLEALRPAPGPVEAD